MRKTMMAPLARCLWLGLLAWPGLVIAQPFSVEWQKIAGGGGASSGGPFTLSGTVGQAEAGVCSGQSLALTGGFWSGVMAVQQPDAPTLEILPAGPGQVTISWTPNVPGFVLEVSDRLSPGSWRALSDGSTNPRTLVIDEPVKFCRLRRLP